jgi:hypothetical protein
VLQSAAAASREQVADLRREVQEASIRAFEEAQAREEAQQEWEATRER